MRKFEAAFRSGYEFYERYYDTNLNKSIKRRIDLPHEWYEQKSTGLYTSILNPEIRLDKKQGNAKQGRGKYGFLDPLYRNIRDNYWNKPDGYNTDARIWFIDIETRVGTSSTGFPVPEKALEPISLIQIYDSITDTLFALGVREWKHESDYKNKFKCSVKYIQCTDEVHLLETFLKIFNKLDPLIIYAWHGAGFDFPYIHNRIKNLGLDVNKLSNYGTVSYSESEYQGKKDFKVLSNGHYFIDIMDVYEKFTFQPMASYSLDAVSEYELNENKVIHTEYANFDDFYTGKYLIPENPTKEQVESKLYKEAVKGNWDEVKELSHSEFVYYGLKDTYLLKLIDDKKNFTALLHMISEKMGVLFSDSTGTVKPWAQYISNISISDNKVMPQKQEFQDPTVVGGHVKDPLIGKHNWVLSADVNSMYPLLGMVGFNMSPETFIPKHKLPGKLRDIVLKHFNDQSELNRFSIPEDIREETIRLLKEHDLALGINGAVFRKDTLGIVPELVLDIYSSRKSAKTKQFEYERKKILITKILKEQE